MLQLFKRSIKEKQMHNRSSWLNYSYTAWLLMIYIYMFMKDHLDYMPPTG